jgi:4a-hydroxytetrahydrobiopterin dehydratase
MKPLSITDVTSKLSELSGWTLDTKAPSISATFNFKDFVSGLKFVNDIGELAEKENHHPDIFLTWGKVTVTFWTHVAHGVTELDLKLAALVNQLPST